MNKKNKNKGFSLIELIIAIAILVILTGLLAPQFMKYIEKSREAKDIQVLDTVYTAVQGAISDEGAYKALRDGMGSSGSYENIKDGISLTALENASDNFTKEVVELLGKELNDFAVNELHSRATSVTNGDIYISIDDNMQVGVYFGTGAKQAGLVNATESGVPFSVGTLPAK